MSTIRSHGKRKIDTWTFTDEHPGTRKREKVEFEVSLLGNREFSLSTSDIDPQRNPPQGGRVLVDLYEQAEKAAREELDLRLGLTWTTWLEVRVRQMAEFDRRGAVQGARAEVAYSTIPRAERPDGSAFTRNTNGCLVPFPTNADVFVATGEDKMLGRRAQTQEGENREPSNSAAGLSQALSRLDHRDTDCQFTYLPDTTENRAGLDALIQAIETVNQRLQDFLKPEAIVQTLARASQSGLTLLPAPEALAPARTKGPR